MGLTQPLEAQPTDVPLSSKWGVCGLQESPVERERELSPPTSANP